VTNHTASARDLFRETISPDNPGMCLEPDGSWQRLEEAKEEILVKGQRPDELVIRTTRRGPIVNEFVPHAGGTESLSLRWVGNEATTGFESMLSLLRSDTVDDVLAALRAWPFPILNFVFADAEGRVGYHAAGRVPKRKTTVPGFRDAVNADHDWDGFYDFDEMPHLVDPERGWVATANNPPLGGAHPYLSLGNWSDGYRFRRIRKRIEAKDDHDLGSVGAIQADVTHGRAEELAGVVAQVAATSPKAEVRQAGRMLAEWDGAFVIDSVAATVFTAFWETWIEAVAAARFPERLVALVKARAGSVARRVLVGDDPGWFDKSTDPVDLILTSLERGLARLKSDVGSRRSQWRWGRLHTVRFVHPMSDNDALRSLLEHGPFETSGGQGTVRAAGYNTGNPFEVTGLSTYRMVVDLSDPAHGKATSAGGQSGHPASPHYRTQTDLWLADDYHPLLMDRRDIERELAGRLVLNPATPP